MPSPDEAKGQALEVVGRRGISLLDVGPLTFVAPHARRCASTRKRRSARALVWPAGRSPTARPTEAGTERRAGVWCSPKGEALGRPPLDDLGPEATDVDADELAALFAAHPMRLHGFLRDQHRIAGLGRRLANEVCHRAQLSPFASTGKLGLDGAGSVVLAIKESIDEGLAYERSRDDMSASADRPGRVHHGTGSPCPVCDDTIREVAYSSYTVHYCPTCQTGGTVLKDNTTSKFLK